MSQNLKLPFVYKRRSHQGNSATMCAIQVTTDAKPSDGCRSAISTDAPSVAAKKHIVSERETESLKSPVMCPVDCRIGAAASLNGFPSREEAGCGSMIDVDRVHNMCCVNDNCSSSRSNLEVNSASLKIDTDDAGECSSSGEFMAYKVPDGMSERDICISLIQSHGLLDKSLTRGVGVSAENTAISHKFCTKLCKICEQSESTSGMLICDNCEDAFHTSCCNPRITRIPVGEWLCTSCLKKKNKILKEKCTSSSVNISSEIGRNGYPVSEGELGSLEFMFRETEPYMSNVRIGDEFQANVPDWSGPLDEPSDLVGRPLELDISNNISKQEHNSTRHLKLSSIGNWLQCREIVDRIGDGVDGTICGKWRRAPLFEVQTDDWECFCCILWDPSHADCAVPQEIDTEEVMKQLKYMEMLRPRLAAKRRKLVDCAKSAGSEDAK